MFNTLLKQVAILGLVCCFNVQSLSAQQVLWYDEPATEWNEAIPVGNGSLGAMVFGKANSERISLNEESLWTGQPVDRQLPNAGKYLSKARELLFNGEYVKAEQLVDDNMMGPAVGGHSYQFLGDLLLNFDHEKAAISSYRRSLNLQQAIAKVSYQADGVTFNREILSSPVDHSLVIHLSSEKNNNISFSVKLARPKDAKINVLQSGKIKMSGQVTGGDAQTNGPPGVHYQAQLQIERTGGKLTAKGDRLIVKNADEVTMYLVAATDYWGENPAEVYDKKLEHVTQKSYAQIRKDHIKQHQRLYNRAAIDLGSSGKENIPTDERLQDVKDGGTDPDLVELYFNYGRYLLISSSRPGGLAANLQGIWADGLTPPWNADYHINVNIQMNYWPAEVTNLAELHKPFFALIDSLRPRGRQTARNLYDSRGFVAHHTTDAWYWTAAIGDPKWGMWPMSVAWSMQHFWDHYAFSRDTSFLRDPAYPIMKEAALFFVDYLVEEPQTGYLVSGPSNSPENTFRTEDGQEANLSMGPTMDMQIIHNLLTNTIKSAQILDVDQAFRDTLSNIKERLRPIEIAEDGRIMEWTEDFEETEPGHRHISHLFALHPGNQIAVRKTPALVEAARKTIDYRLEHGGGHTGWSRAWIINFFARLENGQKAYENVLALLRKSTLKNLFDTHPPFQIDGNFGGTAGIAEMLLQSHAGKINLLPALPNAWANGSVRGFRARGGYEIDFEWKDKRITNVGFNASQSDSCKIRANSDLSVYLNEKKVPIEQVAPGVIKFYAEAGKQYCLTN